MVNYSEKALEESTTSWDTNGWGIRSIYGIITSTSLLKSDKSKIHGPVDHFLVGSDWIGEEELDRRLNSIKSSHDYALNWTSNLGDDSTQEYNVKNNDVRGVAVIGRSLDDKFMTHAGQESFGIVIPSEFERLRDYGSEMILELESIGFSNLDIKDFTIFNWSYNH